ncbi:hypothetical protein NMG60_11019291 [Bertholletia excelsa]
MSSRKGGGKPCIGGSADLLSMEKGLCEGSSQQVDQLSHGVTDLKVASSQNGDWEEVGKKKSRNRSFSNAAKSWIPQHSNSRAWGRPDVAQKLGMSRNGGPGKASGNSWPTPNANSRKPTGKGNLRPQSSGSSLENHYVASQPVISSPLVHGSNWSERAATAWPSDDGARMNITHLSSCHGDGDGDKVDDSDDSGAVDSDDEFLSDEFDSDDSVKSLESRKKNRWFKDFFAMLDKLTVEDIHQPTRQWHCPACQGGPGAIDWYEGLRPLLNHAKTKGSKRMKLHREFADLLDKELRQRGTSVIPASEAFGKWIGLGEGCKDHEIVWPPMVVIMNTQFEKDENGKWTGMGNAELLDYFSSYAAVRARHSYGPQGHRGMSVLIFESSAMGFLEAARLHDHFQKQGTDRGAWDRHRVTFNPGGKRQLYGFLAQKPDLDIFNQHSQSKTRLKFDMRSYEEMVVQQTKQMSEDNQLLIWYKDIVAKEQRRSKALQETLEFVSEKLHKTTEENRIVRLRSKMHHEQNKAEMDYQEQFFKEQLKVIDEARDAKEEDFEKIQQEERKKVKQSNSISSTEDHRLREQKIAKFIIFQDKEMEEFVAEREKLINLHEEKKIAMKRRHLEEEVQLETEFDAELSQLMDKYTPQHSEQNNS